jgi:hypothetical protein
LQGQLIPLTEPRWVKVFTLSLLSFSATCLVISSLWAEWSVWITVSLAIFPFLINYFWRWRNQRPLQDRVLVVWPDRSWELAFFSEVAGLTDSIEVIVIQRWHHLFGLSLSLKLQNCPHNMSKTFMMVVWRQCVSTSVFHQVALQSARQVDCAGRQTKGDAA